MKVLTSVRKRAPRLLLAVLFLVTMPLTVFAPLVSAEDTEEYSAATIENWLVDKLSTTDVTVTTSPTVALDATNRRMVVESFEFEVRGITVGLSFLRFTFDGSRTVEVAGELDVLGKYPRFWCDIELQHLTSDGKLQVTSVSNVKVAEFTPSLSAGDLTTIVDVMNQVLDASGLTTTSPGGDLTGIDVVDNGGAKLATTWTAPATSYLDAGELEAKLDGMADTLAAKATDYLGAAEPSWSLNVAIPNTGTELQLDATFPALGITVAVSDVAVGFDTLTASIADATLSIGTSTKTVTFSLEGDIGCSGGVPSIAMTSLSVGDEHSGFQQFIVDIEAALLAAIDDAVDAIVSDTGLTWPFCPGSITIEGGNVVLHAAGEVTIDLLLKTGWNMVSVPVVPADPLVSTVFDGSVAVYTWNPQAKAYYTPSTVVPKQGYWVAVTNDMTMSVTGTPVSAWDSPIQTGWNMIGTVHTRAVPVGELVDDPDNSILTSAVYWWNPTTKSYNTTVSLEQGKGYWLATIQNCQLYVS